MKRILVLLWHPNPPYTGGSFNCHQQSFEARVQTDIEWIIIDKENSNLEKIRNSNMLFDLYKIPKSINFLLKKIFLIGRPLEWIYSGFVLYKKGSHLIKTQKIDVIYVPIADLLHAILPAYLLKHRFGIHTAVIIHQFEEEADNRNLFQYYKLLRSRKIPLLRAFEESFYIKMMYVGLKFILPRIDICGAISEYSAQRFSHLFKVPFRHLEYGFDYSQIPTEEYREKKYDAVFVARLVHSKGVSDLLPIWKNVVDKIPSAKLLVIGDGDNSIIARTKKFIQKNNLTNNIFLVGQKTGYEKFNLMKQAKLFLYLSHAESYGQVIDEAIVCQLPVIAYDLETYKSRLKYSSTIFLFSKNEIQKLTAKVIDVIEDEEKHKNIVSKMFPTWKDFAVNEQNFLLNRS